MPPPPIPPPRPRVLVADDSRLNQVRSAALLRQLDCEVRCVSDGEAAFRLAKAEAFDLVLMDIEMPVLDGIEATRKMRDHPATRRLRIVALTATHVADTHAACLRAGMDDVFVKPFRPDQVERLLARVRGDHAPEVFDREQLRAATGRDAALQASLLAIFFETTPELLAEIGHAAAIPDFRAMQRLLHKLIGNTATIGAGRLQAAAEELRRKNKAQELRLGEQVIEVMKSYDEFSRAAQADDLAIS